MGKIHNFSFFFFSHSFKIRKMFATCLQKSIGVGEDALNDKSLKNINIRQ